MRVCSSRGGEIQLNAIQIAYYESRVSGAASYNFSTRAFRFDLSGTNFDLVHLPRTWASRLKVEGHMNFTAQGSGTPEEPAINATLHLRDLTFDHEPTGDFTLQAVTHGPELRLVGHSQFQSGELTLEGNVHLRNHWPTTAEIHFTQLDVDAILRPYLGARLTGHSSASGTLEVQGPLAEPRDLSLAGTLGDFSINLENIQLRNRGPLTFAISGQSAAAGGLPSGGRQHGSFRQRHGAVDGRPRARPACPGKRQSANSRNFRSRVYLFRNGHAWT